MSGLGSALGARRYWLVWLAVLPLVLWAVVRLLGLDGGTAIAFLMAFTPQAAVVALFAAGVAVALRNWAAAIVAGLVAVALAAAVLPRAFGGPETPPAGSERLDVMSANVYFGNADPDALVALARRHRPDLLAIQELTPRFDRELRAAGLQRLLPFWVVAPEPASLGGGRGIYSKWPMGRIPGRTKASISVSLPGGTPVRIVNVHPRTPRPGGSGIWQTSLARLPSTGTGPPWVLLGDFNATLDHSALRDVLDRGYRDAGETTGEGLVATWPAGKLIPPQVTIDHVFADGRLGIAGYGVDYLPGSDHRTIHASLFLAPGGDG